MLIDTKLIRKFSLSYIRFIYDYKRHYLTACALLIKPRFSCPSCLLLKYWALRN